MIVGASMDESAEHLLREHFEIGINVNLSVNESFSLGVVGGKLTLGGDCGKAFEAEDSTAGVTWPFKMRLDGALERSPEGATAMCFASSDQMKSAHRALFWFHNCQYPVQWCGARMDQSADPYARRLLEIGEGKTAVSVDLQERQISNSARLGRHRLIVEPLELYLRDDQAALCGSGEYRDVWFLPPVRTEDNPSRRESYFSADRLNLRAALRELAGTTDPKPHEPAAIAIQRMVDDPALRDLFLDGASLLIAGGNDEPTRVELQVFSAPSAGELINWRSAVALALPDFREWVGDLVQSLHGDIRLALGGGFVRVANSAVNWSTAESEAYSLNFESQLNRAYTALAGFWHSVKALEEELASADHQAAHSLREHVLRDSCSLDGYMHSHAIDLFSKHCWRCPMESPTEFISGWRYAMVDLHNVHSAQFSDLLIQLAETQGHLIVESAGRLHVKYAGRPTESQLWHWKMLYPLGTIFGPRTLCLNSGERSRLNHRFVLG